MIRLTIYLLAALAGLMYFGDSMPKPELAAVTATAKVHVAPLVIRNPKSAGPILVAAKPAVADRNANKTVLAPFKTPMIVKADGTLVADSANATQAVARQTVAPTSTAATPVDVRYVNADKLNVRAGPSTGNAVVDQLFYADAVQVVETTSDGWVRIRIEGDGVEGYIAERFLQATNPVN